MTPSHGLFGLLFAAGATLGACTGPYSTTDSEGSSTGEECPVGGLGCLCTTGNSCDEGLVCASKKCVKPGGGDDTSTGEPTTSVDPTTEAPTSTTAGSDCDPGGNGEPDVSCPDAASYCVAGECFACSAIDCSQVSPEQPLCDEATGLCAACLCNDASPVCDPETHTCSGCTAQSDCPSSACDLWTGACFPVSDTLWVDSVGCDDAGPGDAATPLCKLEVAFERISAAAPGHQAVRVRPGSYSVAATLRAPADHVVALVHATGGADDAKVEITAASSAVLGVDAGGKLIVDALHLAKVGADAFTCETGEAKLDRLTISEAKLHGIVATDCKLALRRGVLFNNVVSGVTLTGGTLRLENSYISKNGNQQTGEGGIYLASGAQLNAVYSTWVENRGQAGTPFAVACSDDGPKEKVTVRNALAINLGNNTLCDGATVEHTGWSTDEVTGDNMAIALADLGMYLTPDGSLPGVYRVTPGAGLDTLAAWVKGDPAIDFDGDVRPAADNAPDYAGADRVAR